MFSHGIMTALFFACVGMVYDRAHTRDIPSLGGFVQKLPWVAVAFIIGGFVSMGMPGLSGFVAEFPIFVGLWDGPVTEPVAGWPTDTFNYYGAIAIIAVLGIIVTAAYVLRVGQVFGEFNEERFPGVTSITVYDKIALGLLIFWLVLVGIYRKVMALMIDLVCGRSSRCWEGNLDFSTDVQASILAILPEILMTVLAMPAGAGRGVAGRAQARAIRAGGLAGDHRHHAGARARPTSCPTSLCSAA